MWEAFKTFFKIGAFTIGGGYAMIPVIETEVVEKHKWVSREEFLDLIAVAQSCPGVFAVNISIFIGYKLKQTKGAVITTLGTILPSFLIILLIAMCFRQFQDNEIVASIFRGIRPAVVALIAVPTFNMAKSAKITLANCWIPIVTALLIWLLGVNPIYIILAAAVAGLLYSMIIGPTDKTDNTDMPAANYSSVDFETDVQGMYQYFRLEVSTVQSGDGLQLSEMQLYGCSSWEFFFRYGNVNVTPASATNELTVALNNQSGASDTYTLTAVDGSNEYTFKKSGVTFESGKYYAITVKMANAADYKPLSAATAEDIGKVVCADGHLHDAKTAILAGCTAVGILGKVTETGCGLILALKDATAQTWNTINGWTSVTSYAGTTLKVLPDATARGANLTSYAALGTTAVSDWAVAQQSDYEAIFTNLGSTTNSDGMTYDANVNAYITTGVGGTALDGNYWSATENKFVDLAYCFGSVIGWGLYPMSESLSVRPVLGFGPAKLLSAATTSDVGKVVCADGHLRDAKTAVPAGGTAVGILGKVTETGHGLILALKDATAQNWNTINSWTSVTTYAGTTLKVLPDDAAHGTNLTSYTTLGTTAAVLQ